MIQNLICDITGRSNSPKYRIWTFFRITSCPSAAGNLSGCRGSLPACLGGLGGYAGSNNGKPHQTKPRLKTQERRGKQTRRVVRMRAHRPCGGQAATAEQGATWRPGSLPNMELGVERCGLAGHCSMSSWQQYSR